MSFDWKIVSREYIQTYNKIEILDLDKLFVDYLCKIKRPGFTKHYVSPEFIQIAPKRRHFSKGLQKY
jgi:intein/homing endonuclease